MNVVGAFGWFAHHPCERKAGGYMPVWGSAHGVMCSKWCGEGWAVLIYELACL